MTYTPGPGDIGITKISGAGGLAIRCAQYLDGSGFRDFEHAFVVTSASNGIVEAMPGGARYIENWHTDTVYLRCPDEYRYAVAQAALGYIGVPYSFADYAAIAAHRLHIPYPQLEAYIKTSGRMICSQLADASAADGGWHLFADGRWPGDVTPGDLEILYARQVYA